MKKFISFIASFILIIASFAQDSTAVGTPAASAFPSWVYIGVGVALGVYEVLVRIVPTVGNWSILSMLIKAIKAIFPNNAPNGATHAE